MPKVIAYATSDWHVPEGLDAPTWRELPAVHGDVLHALSVVVGMCVTDRVPLLAAGDLVDGPDLTPEALAAWFAVLRPLADHAVPLLYVSGNHERSRDWLAAFGPTAVRLDGRVVNLPSGHSVSGLSFIPPAQVGAALAAVARVTDVGLYHQAVAEFGPGKGLSVGDFPPHPLAVIGDTHVGVCLEPSRGPRRALSPGPLAPQSVAEFGPPGVWAVYDDLTVRRVKVPARGYHRFDVASPADADACVTTVATLDLDTRLPAHLAAPMVAVRLATPLDGFVAAIRDLAARKGFPLRVLEPGLSGVVEDTTTVPVRIAADLLSVISNWPGISPGARRLAVALADPSADPAELLDADRAAYAADPDEADRFAQTD